MSLNKPEDLDHMPLTFGKYKDQTPSSIAEEDPGYIVWLYDTWIDKLNPPLCSPVLAADCRRDMERRDSLREEFPDGRPDEPHFR